MKIQPLEFQDDEIRVETSNSNGKVVKSRLKRLFDRQFQRVLKITENGSGGGGGGAAVETEPSSVCLSKMVQNFIEENNNEKHHLNSSKCSRSRCNCFKSNNNNITNDDEQVDLPCNQSIELLKTLVQCSSLPERNLLADTSRIFDINKLHKRKDEETRRIVAERLVSLGYDASVVKSHWDKSSSHLAGEYEYIDVMIDKERILIDMDFRSEFQIARPTGSYKSLLQTLPFIFIGKSERLSRIITIMSDAARQSLKQKGMPFPPWRKSEYMKCKWLASYVRACGVVEEVGEVEGVRVVEGVAEEWKLPEVRVKSLEKDRKGVVVATGLASLLQGKD